MSSLQLPNTFGVFLVLEILAAPFGYEGASAIMNRQWKRAGAAYVIAVPLAVAGLLALGVPIFGKDLTVTIGSSLTSWLRSLSNPYFVVLLALLDLAWLGGDRFVRRISSALNSLAPSTDALAPSSGFSGGTGRPRSNIRDSDICRPQIVYDHTAEMFNEGDGNLYTHLWFRNRVIGRAAHNAVALITWTSESDEKLFSLTGKWREVPYDLGPAIYAANRIDLLPNDEPRALDLCIRKPDSADCYALSVESPHRGPYAEDRRLIPGTYNIKVTLSCDGYLEDFRFKIAKWGSSPIEVIPNP